ncbi:MAG: flagellar motor switch protein FliN [SAR324 cluster bacterium]|jgi:flagellar motor switch protein FliN/FliY|uniref:Flagellar motor switch protein FliN-like C-terminal domain-containing protein n=1 Tax=marine metagenome TaxID=408172 RepID=A0A381THS8_9ZZZZ|nr:flagellar motor switch protein FliN [SAR324 cluster bacterium]MCS5554821.1 flagellar motor switch protein FliN [SAR324 cluster bacterium]|tara:strand:+ start:1608 stop:2126 length:519 start_codon:yes stop_codon:yes gene_type:complete
MANEEEQEKKEAANAEDDMDSLMDELEEQQTKPENIERSEDLSSLVTEKTVSSDENLDQMLESAADSSTPEADASSDEEGVDLKLLLELPLTMTFEVGRAKMSISNLLSLGQGSVLDLHRLVGEDLDILVNGKLIAQGEVVISNEKFCAKITNVIPPEERVKKMAGMDKSNL